LEQPWPGALRASAAAPPYHDDLVRRDREMVPTVIPGKVLHLRWVPGHLEVLSGGDLPHLRGGVLVARGEPPAVGSHCEREDRPLPAVLVHGGVGARPRVVPSDAAVARSGDAPAAGLPGDRCHGAGVATVAG